MRQIRHIQDLTNKDVELLAAPSQSVIAYGRNLAEGETLPFHRHRRAQLVYASKGVMTVCVQSARFLVPANRAVWVPGTVEHKIEARTNVSMRTLYINTESTRTMPKEVCVLQVSPLLRELIIAAVSAGYKYEDNSPESRIMAVIFDQLITQPVRPLELPIPTDPRLLKIVQWIIENPADSRSLLELAYDAGASERTISRLFTAQTGISFRLWRQQRRLHHAIELLQKGESVTAIAIESGYENTSAFIAMFRRHFGVTPSRYINQSNS